MERFADELARFIDYFTDEAPDTALEEIVAALEAKAIALRQQIAAAGNPGAN